MATAISMKEFTVSGCWWQDWLGGGWTPETVPTAKGWRAAKAESLIPEAVLIGRKGVKGCFSAVKYRDLVDIMFYDDRTPEEVVAGAVKADDSTVVPFIPGWAVQLIQQMEEISN